MLDKSRLDKSRQPESSQVTWQRFTVAFEFPVHFSYQLFDPVNTVFVDTLCRLEPQKRHQLLLFVDEGLLQVDNLLVDQIHAYCRYHSNSLNLIAAPVCMPGGERLKSDLQSIQTMQQLVADYRLDRHSYVVAVGGGALLDAVGLVAATSHRGIRHIRVPTTVLAQNDSGVGVKNGINLFGQKNYLGTFTPPFAVLNDYAFVETLSDRDKIAGIAEAVKVALIRDADFFHWLEEHRLELTLYQRDAMEHMIRQCAELHMRQIGNGGDPFETGSARPLDYGHWIAHRLETLTQYKVRHGEAVAIGLALDTRYSVLCGLLDAGLDERVCTLLEDLGFRLWHPELRNESSDGKLKILRGLADFREHLGGELTITLLSSIGEGIEVHEISDEQVIESLDWLEQRVQN